MKPTRRTVTRTAAWTVPVIAVSAQVPAFAVSQRCRPIGRCKNPGNPNDKSYTVITSCGIYDPSIVSVSVDAKLATQDETANGAPIPGQWTAPDFKDSRSTRDVVITYDDGTVETYPGVAFTPC